MEKYDLFILISTNKRIIKEMNKEITKRKLVLSLSPESLEFLENNFENKSKYIEYLIYKDMKENDLIKNDLLII